MKQDIRSWLYQNFDVKPEKGGRELAINCPFCGDTRHKLYVNAKKPVWQCKLCGRKGSWTSLVRQVDKISYKKAMGILTGDACRNVYEYEKRFDLYKTDRDITPSDEYPPYWYRPLFESLYVMESFYVYNHVRRRGFSNEDIKKYGFGICIDQDLRQYGRLVIPVEWPYWQARDVLGESTRKYINPSMPIGHRMFNWRALEHYDTIIIAEGVFSAIACGENAVAVLGSSIKEEQAYRIVQAGTKHVELAPDAGFQYKIGTIDAADYFESHGLTVSIRQYKWGDPDDNPDYTVVGYGLSYKTYARLGGTI